MSQRYDERLLGNRHVVPVLVILREYAVDKKNHSSSILQHIESICCSKYQIEPPPGAFEFFLRNGHLAIIFDGLDELIDTSFRQEISSDIESFCSLYPNVPALIISREVGYEQAPLDENRFEVFRLTPFTEEQVGEYVKKWFSIDVELLPEQKTQKVKAFINESLIVPDLRSNPLMLALMCNIYRGENYIPRNRPDVYEKCALLLFERLDKSKGIYIQFPFEAHINPAIKYIAHWIYENEDLQDGVAENKLIQKATEYLCNRRFEDIDEATKAAREFIEFCKGRAWVFTDIGTTKEGERLYQFTHRTFLEYFTAAHLVRIYPIPEKLKDILLPKILKREWDVVAQLAIQMQNKNVEGAGDVLLEEIVNFAQDAALYDSINLLFFAGRCLEFMVPSPKITRIITKSTMLTCLKLGLYIYSFDQQKSTYKIESKESAESFLSGILNASIENRPIVTDSIEKFYVDNFNMSGEKETNILFEIGANLDISIHQFYKKQANDLIEYWRGVSEKFTLNFETSILQMSTKNFSACLYLYRRKKSSIDIIIQRFGLSSVFLKKYLLLFPSVFFMSIVESIIISLITGYSFNGPDLSDQLDLLGKIFEENSLPWIRETELGINHYFDMPKFWIYNDQKDLSIQINLSPKGYFAIFGIMAIIYEKAEKRNNQNKFLDYFKRDWININWMFPILHTRRERKWDEKVAKILKNLKFSDINKEIVFNWINRKIKFSD
jgi:hypothetical protein